MVYSVRINLKLTWYGAFIFNFCQTVISLFILIKNKSMDSVIMYNIDQIKVISVMKENGFSM